MSEGYFDTCLSRQSPATSRGWYVGISVVGHEAVNDARFTFYLQTDRSFVGSTLVAHTRYSPLTWTHIAVTYDQRYMRMFVNGAMVGTSQDQKGTVFSELRADCKQFTVGGGIVDDNTYRGSVDELFVWSAALSQEEIRQAFLARSSSPYHNTFVVLAEHFEYLDHWKILATKSVHHFVNDFTDLNWHDIRPVVPSCGQTICDDPLIAASYSRHWHLRQKKEVINVKYLNKDRQQTSLNGKYIKTGNRLILTTSL